MWWKKGEREEITSLAELRHRMELLESGAKITYCKTCFLAFKPRSGWWVEIQGVRVKTNFEIAWGPHTPIGMWDELEAEYCSRCVEKKIGDRATTDWAKANPDKAKLCMEKHIELDKIAKNRERL